MSPPAGKPAADPSLLDKLTGYAKDLFTTAAPPSPTGKPASSATVHPKTKTFTVTVEAPKLPAPDYLQYEIGAMRVLIGNQYSKPTGHDAPMGRDQRAVSPEEAKADIVVSGTFHDNRTPAGTVAVNGKVIHDGWGYIHRGGAAVLTNGRIRVGESPRTMANLDKTYSVGGAKVRDFLGGGALLVIHGVAVAENKFLEKSGVAGGQGFTKTNGAVEQFNVNARHTLVGVHRNGKAYLVIDTNTKSITGMQADFVKQGFMDVVMFDGGNAFGYQDKHGKALFGRESDRYTAPMSAKEVGDARGQHDIALTALAVQIAGAWPTAK